MMTVLKGFAPARFCQYNQRMYATQTTHFQRHLLALASRSISREEYLTNCIITVKEAVQSPDHGFYEAGIRKARPLLDLFQEMTSESSFMTLSEIACINHDFQNKFCETIAEKLAADAGQAFFTIPQLSEKEKKIASAQLWTEHFFYGLNSLCDFQDKYALGEPLIKEFTEKTSNHLRDYAHCINEQKLKAMIVQMDSNPAYFQRTLEKVLEKAEADPSSLSSLEKEYVEFAQMYVNYTMRNFPDINQKVDLLKQCIWLGYTNHTLNRPAFEHYYLFDEIFKE